MSRWMCVMAVYLLLGGQRLCARQIYNTLQEDEECHRNGKNVWRCKKFSECPCAGLILQKGGKLRACPGKDSHADVICCPQPPVKRILTTVPISERKCAEYKALLCSGTTYRGPYKGGEEPKGMFDKGSLTRTKRDESEDDDEDKDLFEEETGTEDTVPDPYLGIYKGNKSAPGEFPHSSDVEWFLEEVEDEEQPGCNTLSAVGGHLAKPAEHPHMALIGYGSESSITWECGGSLISERFVLSAAHCSDTVFGLAQWVRLGDLEIDSDTDEAQPQQFRIVDRIVHPSYKPPTIYNDVVLFRLDRDVVFNRYVGPACLHNSRGDLQGYGIATGWGRIESNGPKSPALIEVELKYLSSGECKRMVGTIKDLLPNGVDAQTMMCAGEPGKDTCKGDSGGPLILADKGDQCLRRQLGVTSFGPYGCGRNDATGTYVRVNSFVPWIESIVWPQ